MENQNIDSASSKSSNSLNTSFTVSPEKNIESIGVDHKVKTRQDTDKIAKSTLLKKSEILKDNPHIASKTISTRKLSEVKKADSEFKQDFPSVASNQQKKIPKLQMSLNLEADHIQQKVKDLDNNRKFVLFVKKGAETLISEEGFSKGKYTNPSSTYTKAASDCRKAASTLIEQSTGKDNESIQSLEKMAILFDRAAENINSTAKELNNESKAMLSKLASEDVSKNKVIENNEIAQARNLYKPGYKEEKISQGSDAQPLVKLSKKCIEESKNLFISKLERNELRMNAHILAEKGARIRMDKGKSANALEVRSELLSSLGAPSFSDNTKLKELLTDKNLSIYGAFVHDMSSKNVKGGNINVDYRITSHDGKNKEITAINMTMNYHVTENMQNTIKMEKESIIKALVATYPELDGKITIGTEDKVFRQFLDKKNKIYDGNESNGKALGRSFVLNIEGVGKLSIPIVPECKVVVGKTDGNGRPVSEYDEADQKYVVFVPHLAGNKAQGYAPSNTTIYHDVYLEMDGTISAEDKLKYSQGMLTMMGAGPVFENDESETKEKVKILEAFHAFFPSQALKLKIQDSSYSCSTEELTNKINESIQAMDKNIFDNYTKNAEINTESKIPNLFLKEHYIKELSNHAAGVKGYREALTENKVQEFISMSGKKEYSVSNKSEVIKECCEKSGNPFWGFFAGCGGSGWSKDVNGRDVVGIDGKKVPAVLTQAHVDTATLILKGGLKSTHTLISQGIFPKGDSPAEDLANGAGKGVYLRPAGLSTAEKDCNDATLAGVFKVRVGMRVLDKHACTVAFKVDAYGANSPTNVTNGLRDKNGVLDNEVFKQEPTTQFYSSMDAGDFKTTEVVSNEMVDPEAIDGITVSTEENRLLMRAGLLNSGLFDQNESFNGIHIDTFLIFSDRYSNNNWST